MTGLPQAPAMTALDKATWDAWNRLVAVEEPDGLGGWRKRAEYGYDGQTWRILAKAYTGGTLTETLDLYYTAAWQVLEERGAGATQAQYVWNPMYIDALVLRDRSAGGCLNERLYAMQDANFNTTAIVDTSGTVKERYDYTPFGVVAYRDASWNPLPASEYAWVYLFQGGKLDPKVGLTNFRYRDLMMTLGRWMSQDPIGYKGGTNQFRMRINSPGNNLDPAGLLDVKMMSVGTPQTGDFPDKDGKGYFYWG